MVDHKAVCDVWKTSPYLVVVPKESKLFRMQNPAISFRKDLIWIKVVANAICEYSRWSSTEFSLSRVASGGRGVGSDALDVRGKRCSHAKNTMQQNVDKAWVWKANSVQIHILSWFRFFSRIDDFVKIFYTTMVSFSRTLDVTLIILFSCHKHLKCNKYSCATVKKKWLQ